MTNDATKTCRCGHAMGHPRVQPSYSYGFLGILGLMFGVTPSPNRVDYKCGVCGETVETIRDKAALAKLRYGPKES